jgi:hypothetical protein
VNVHVNFNFNQRGSSPFPYYRESVRGTAVTTNLENDGSYTNVFTANSRDHTIVNNGDGTITITTYASGGSRFYDTNGKLVLRDPGQFRFALDIDYNGTPGDPSDDVEAPTRSGSCATPPVATTSPGATSARTWWSSPIRSPAPRRPFRPALRKRKGPALRGPFSWSEARRATALCRSGGGAGSTSGRVERDRFRPPSPRRGCHGGLVGRGADASIR